MCKIKIHEGKILSLKKAAQKSFYNINPANIKFYLEKFIKEISVNSKSLYGPVIVTFKRNDINRVMKFMIQCKSDQNFINIALDKVEDFKSNECIYTRFNGKMEDLKFIFQKMEVYAYENGILLDGTVFLVFLKSEMTNYTIDIFSQIQKI